MGRIICCGLGPGDPDLMSVRADREIRAARHVAYFRKKGRPGQARRIVEGMLAPDAREYPMEYPVTTEMPFDSAEYARLLAASTMTGRRVLCRLARDADVVVLCEGDPLLLWFVHASLYPAAGPRRDRGDRRHSRHGRLLERGRRPIALGDDVMTVLMGTLRRTNSAPHARHRCAGDHEDRTQSAQSPPRAAASAGRLDEAWLVERGTMPGERVARLRRSTPPSVPISRSCWCTARAGGRSLPPNDGDADHRRTRARRRGADDAGGHRGAGGSHRRLRLCSLCRSGDGRARV